MVSREDDDDVSTIGDDDSLLGELIEELTRCVEAGEPLCNCDRMGASPDRIGPVRAILPTMQTLVSVGELMAHRDDSERRSRLKKRIESSQNPDASPEKAQEVGP